MKTWPYFIKRFRLITQHWAIIQHDLCSIVISSHAWKWNIETHVELSRQFPSNDIFACMWIGPTTWWITLVKSHRIHAWVYHILCIMFSPAERLKSFPTQYLYLRIPSEPESIVYSLPFLVDQYTGNVANHNRCMNIVVHTIWIYYTYCNIICIAIMTGECYFLSVYTLLTTLLDEMYLMTIVIAYFIMAYNTHI